MPSRVYLPVDGDAIELPVTGTAESEDDRARVAALFDAHHQRLFRLARRLAVSADAAQDLVQEAFLRVARRPKAVPRGAVSEEAWLVRVLVNLARDGWRRRAVQQRYRERHGQEARHGVTDSGEAAAVASRTIWRALESLDPRRRAAIVLYELEDVGIPEIARLLGVSSITVRWHLSRGRRELARLIDGKDEP